MQKVRMRPDPVIMQTFRGFQLLETRKCRLTKSALRPAARRVSRLQPLFTVDHTPAGNLFKFAHLSGDVSSTFGSYDNRLPLMNCAGETPSEAIATSVLSQQMLPLQGEAQGVRRKRNRAFAKKDA
jgi:hypothetical protein